MDLSKTDNDVVGDVPVLGVTVVEETSIFAIADNMIILKCYWNVHHIVIKNIILFDVNQYYSIVFHQK